MQELYLNYPHNSDRSRGWLDWQEFGFRIHFNQIEGADGACSVKRG